MASRGAAMTDLRTGGDAVVVRDGGSLGERPIAWLWDGRVPREALTVVVGPSGGGKTALLAAVAAMALRNNPPPDVGSKPCQVWWVDGGGRPDRVVPRFLAAA